MLHLTRLTIAAYFKGIVLWTGCTQTIRINRSTSKPMHSGWTPFYFMYDPKCSTTFPWCTINAPAAFALCTINVPAAFARCTNRFVHKVEFSYIGWNGVHPLCYGLKYGMPQGSVLGRILFVIYTTPRGKLIRSHGLTNALDTPLYLAFRRLQSSSIDNDISRLEKWVQNIRTWMKKNLF